MSEVVENLWLAHASGNGTALQEIYEFIVENRENPTLVNAIVGSVLNTDLEMWRRKLMLSAIHNCGITLDNDHIAGLIECLGNSDLLFVGMVACVLGGMIAEPHVEQMLTLSGEFFFGVVATFSGIDVSLMSLNVVTYLGFVLTHGNIWEAALSARVLSRTNINEFEGLPALILERFSVPFLEDSYAVQCELVAGEDSLVWQVDEGPEKLTVCIDKLAELAALVPFDSFEPAPDGTKYSLSDMAMNLLEMIDYMCILYDRGWPYDAEKLAKSLMALCVPSREESESWMTNPESFFTDYFGNIYDDCCNTLRYKCADTLLSMFTLEELGCMLNEMSCVSAWYKHAALYIIGEGYQPGSPRSPMDIGEPNANDPLLLCEYLKCCTKMGILIPHEILADCFTSGSFQLLMTAAYAVKSNPMEYEQLICPTMEGLTQLFGEFQTDIIGDIIEQFHELARYVANEDASIIPGAVGVMLDVWSRFVGSTQAAEKIADCITYYAKSVETFTGVLEIVHPTMMDAFQSPWGANAACYLAAGFVRHLPVEGVVVPEEWMGEIFSAIESLLTSLEDRDVESLQTIMAFFVRMNVIEPFDRWFVAAVPVLETCSSDLAISLLLHAPDESKEAVMTVLLELFAQAESDEEKNEPPKIATVFAFVYSIAPEIITRQGFPVQLLADWMHTNFYHSYPCPVTAMIWINFLLNILPTNVDGFLVTLIQFMNDRVGMSDERDRCYFIHESLPVATNHPFFQMSFPQFCGYLIETREDLPPVLVGVLAEQSQKEK